MGPIGSESAPAVGSAWTTARPLEAHFSLGKSGPPRLGAASPLEGAWSEAGSPAVPGRSPSAPGRNRPLRRLFAAAPSPPRSVAWPGAGAPRPVRAPGSAPCWKGYVFSSRGAIAAATLLQTGPPTRPARSALRSGPAADPRPTARFAPEA